MNDVRIEALEARQLLSASAADALHAQVTKPYHMLLGPLPAGTDPSALYVTGSWTKEQINAAQAVRRGKKLFARDTLTFLATGEQTVSVSTSARGAPIFTTQVKVGPNGPFSNSTIQVRRMLIDPVVANQQTTAPAELIGVPSSIKTANATIDWGDGTAPDVVSVINADGIVDPVAQHVYSTARKYIAKITFSSGTRRLGSAREVIQVQQQSADGMTLKLTSGVPFSGVLGVVTVFDTPQQVAIFWGDRTHSSGIATSIGNNRYQISGTHTYALPSSYSIKLEASADFEPLISYPGMVELNIETYPMDVGQTFSTAVVNGPGVTLPPPSAQITAPSTTVDAPGGVLSQLGVTVTPIGSDKFDNVVYATVDWGDGTPVSSNSADTVLDPSTGKFDLDRNFAGVNGTLPVDKTLVVTLKIYLNDHDDPSRNTVLGTAQVTVHVHNP